VFALASAAEAAPRVIAGGRYCHAVASGSAQAPSDAIRTLTTALSEAPVRVPGENKIVRFRGFDFTAEGRLQPPFFGASPGGEWIAIMGSMGVAIYDVASGDKVVDIQTSERLTRPGWISDRHFIVLIGQSMMVCDLRAPESAASTIWNLPSKEAEILGFREEASIGDVAGRAGRIALYVGVRVPVPGQYRVALTVENERGNSITSSQQAELSNVVSQVEIDVDPPRGADGLLTIRDVTLERNVGSNWAPIAQRAMLGAIGPYRLSKTASKVSTAAKTPLIATTPLKTATLPGTVELLSALPPAGAKIDTLLVKLGIPRIGGYCTWHADLESAGKLLERTSVDVAMGQAPESIVFEFRTASVYPHLPEGDIRLTGVNAACSDGETVESREFSGFSDIIPGLRVSMLRLGTPPSATFTGDDRVEFLDDNHDGKFEAVRVSVGFWSDRRCRVTGTFYDTNGSRYSVYSPLYDPHEQRPGVVFYISFVDNFTAGDHRLDDFTVRCEDADGRYREPSYDKHHRVALGEFTSEQFQPPYVLSFENEHPPLADGELVYTVNCKRNLAMDLAIGVSASTTAPGAQVELDSERIVCGDHPLTVRIRPAQETPPDAYDVSIVSGPADSNIVFYLETKWVKSEGPQILGVWPNTGAGKRAGFRVAAEDPAGVAKIELLIGETEDSAKACQVTIVSGSVVLNDDNGRALNGQCALEKGSTGGAVRLIFAPSFEGAKKIFVRATSGDGVATSWMEEGSWKVNENEVPTPIAASPYWGEGSRQTFSFYYADRNGAEDLERLEAVVGLTPNDDAACHLIVERAANRVSLAGGSSIQLGDAGMITGRMCRAAHVRVVETRGRALRLSADLEFTAAFRGRRNVFLRSSDRAKAQSDWLWVGTWEVR